MTLKVGILAGEASGDLLGAGLMQALQRSQGAVEFQGVGGERMLAAGLQPLYPMDALAVNGFKEPLLRLPSLLRMLLGLRRHFLNNPPDVFIGVDFNVFNLLLERRLKARGIATVHYVSPSVYAWRRGRINRIGKAADLVLALYPFEPPLYAHRQVNARFVGHPLADEIAPGNHRPQARARLGLSDAHTWVALLPGSRGSEVALLGPLMLATAAALQQRQADVAFLVPCITPAIAAAMQQYLQAYPQLQVQLHAGDARDVLAAADVALVKSGTGTLEAMLLGTPMVVTYKLGGLSYRLVKALKRSEFVALPNILADRALVPELLQDAATPAALADALLGELAKARAGIGQTRAFAELHAQLRLGANEEAARAVLELIAKQ